MSNIDELLYVDVGGARRRGVMREREISLEFRPLVIWSSNLNGLLTCV